MYYGWLSVQAAWSDAQAGSLPTRTVFLQHKTRGNVLYDLRLGLRGHGGVRGCWAPRTDLKGCAWQREWAVVQFCRNIFENNPGSEYHHNKSWLARSAESWWELTVKPCTQPQAWVHSLVLLYVSSAFPQQYQVCVNTAVTAIASNKVGVS